jgi:hypothetical protein
VSSMGREAPCGALLVAGGRREMEVGT